MPAAVLDEEYIYIYLIPLCPELDHGINCSFLFLTDGWSYWEPCQVSKATVTSSGQKARLTFSKGTLLLLHIHQDVWLPVRGARFYSGFSDFKTIVWFGTGMLPQLILGTYFPRHLSGCEGAVRFPY